MRGRRPETAMATYEACGDARNRKFGCGRDGGSTRWRSGRAPPSCNRRSSKRRQLLWRRLWVGPHPGRQLLRLAVLCAALPLSMSRPATSSCPLAAVVGGCGGCGGWVLPGQEVRGCPFRMDSRMARGSPKVAVAGGVAPADGFCPCERIRIAKLLVLSASGGTGMAGKIQFCVGALCVVDFCCGLPTVRCLLVRSAQALRPMMNAHPSSRHV